MEPKDWVTITEKEYLELLKSDRELNALYAHGVDNWDGYGLAMEALGEDDVE